MQAEIDEPWFEQDDPETIEITVGIEGVGRLAHDVPVAFLEQEFSDDEARRQFLQERVESMGLDVSIRWRDNQ